MRVILILVVLGGLILLLAYNLSPVSLVFLGVRTPALPLAVWILLSVAVGAIASLFITGLYGLSNYFTRSPRSKRRNNVKVPPPPPPPREQSREAERTTYTAPEPVKPKTESNFRTESTWDDELGDWGSNSTKNDDWNTDDWKPEVDTTKTQNPNPQTDIRDSRTYEVDTTKTQNPNPPTEIRDSRTYEVDTTKTQNPNPPTEIRDSRTYEVNNEPQSSSRSGSVYSYSYQEPKNSGVGKTESIYDADYRVIKPPLRQIDTPPKDEDWGDEDWGFEDDDFFEDEDDNSSTKGGGR